MDVRQTLPGGKVLLMRILLSLVVLALATPWSWAASPRPIPVSEQVRSDVRDAVEAHRASQKDDIRRADAAAGRHLTAAERTQLRDQLRQQWTSQQPQSARTMPSQAPLRRSGGPALDNVRATGDVGLPRTQTP
ncbi:hypothetical protein QTI66_10145 [Variovorax sp. J22R133]|uniref:hypothetical protein n=1 Tax=Variovorax brevis TaxID=3053503 RepID=UPI0025786D50|nr:hypothetical protein [Variovorax sp. J22R133]MDM0112511.1 hypothetical protein [Variovorax sp. J22R133]